MKTIHKTFCSIFFMLLVLFIFAAPSTVFAATIEKEPSNEPIVITSTGFSSDGIPYICFDTIIQNYTNPSLRGLMSFNITRQVMYGAFSTKTQADNFSGYPSSMLWSEAVAGSGAGSTMARGTLYYSTHAVSSTPGSSAYANWWKTVTYKGTIFATS